MREDEQVVVRLPRFSPWMKRLSIAIAAVWVFEIVLRTVAPAVSDRVISLLALSGPVTLGRWHLWSAVTYAWIDDPARFGIAWSILGFWWLGSPIERMTGARRVLELTAVGILGGAVTALVAWRVAPTMFQDSVVGMSAAGSALLAGLGFVYADVPVTFFGTAPMRGRHLVLALAALTVLQAVYIRSADGAARIGGLLAGAAWMWAHTRPPARASRTKPRQRRGSGAQLRVVGSKDKDADGEKKLWN